VHGRPLAAVGDGSSGSPLTHGPPTVKAHEDLGNGASAVAIFNFFSFFICLSWQNYDDIEAQLVWFITETEMLSSKKF
jgi:hypothetical protein